MATADELRAAIVAARAALGKAIAAAGERWEDAIPGGGREPNVQEQFVGRRAVDAAACRHARDLG